MVGWLRQVVEVDEQQKHKLISVDLNGGNRRDHAQGEMEERKHGCPDRRRAAVRREQESADERLDGEQQERRQADRRAEHQRRGQRAPDHGRPEAGDAVGRACGFQQSPPPWRVMERW